MAVVDCYCFHIIISIILQFSLLPIFVVKFIAGNRFYKILVNDKE